ncbi:MAG TPA: hypothetical protein DD414_12100 [Lachnospiraceae bacterium]|nr:hypothetical protein [Lachnospiraceae bacterium]
MLKKRLVSMGLVATMVMSMGLTAMASGTEKAESSDYTFYFVADPTLVDDGFAYAPMKITVPKTTADSTTLFDIVKPHIVCAEKDPGSPTYITEIKSPGVESFSLTATQVNSLGLNGSGYNNPQIVITPEDTQYTEPGNLGEREFSGYSGWMMTVDNLTQVGSYYLSMGSTIAEMKENKILDDDEAIVQMFYSFNMGADIGMGTQYLPTAVMANASYPTWSRWEYTYNWSGPAKAVTSFDRADSTALVKAMADTSKSKTGEEYMHAVEVLKDLRSSSEDIAEAAAAL